MGLVMLHPKSQGAFSHVLCRLRDAGSSSHPVLFLILFNIVKLRFININGNEINAKIFHSLIMLV